MLTPEMMHDYQKKMVNFQCTRPYSAIWADMGLGKTAVTLTSISHLINVGHLRAVVIVAPIRVCRLVWRQESKKWAHLENLRFSMVMGTKDQRLRALMRPADIYMTNFENLGWLAETMHTYFISKKKEVPFDGLVWDEISKCKNSSTDRVKSVMKIVDHFKWRTGLTGTPASNGLKDLHGQFLVLDGGHRLGKSKTAFKTRFYRKVGPYKEVPFDDTDEVIKNLVGDMTLEMSAEDYNPLPDLVVNDIEVEMSDETRAKYEQMEKEFFLRLDSGTEMEMFNQASLMNKCLQYSNGAVYPIAGMPLWEPIHDEKLDALDDIIDEAAGKPVLVAYAFRSDAERIMQRFKDLDPINLTECKSEHALNMAMHRWKTGQCRLMIGHPACLHPRTKVLTERRGWINIVDVRPDERVFDGVEFVNHSGCSYSGYRDVIDVFGITMTPNHKLFIDGQWVEAKDVRNIGNAREKALYRQWEGVNIGQSKVPEMWCGTRNVEAERGQEQQDSESTLFDMHRGHLSSANKHSYVEDMARVVLPSERPTGQKLWWARNYGKSRVGELLKLLPRYEEWIRRQSDNRKNRRELAIWADELQVGDKHGAAGKQTQQPESHVPGGTDTSCRTGEKVWVLEDDAGNATQSRDERGRSSEGLRKLSLRQKSDLSKCSSPSKADVYDLVDCGPRHQFLIMNDDGEMFVSHNSMGHGVDGLQRNGNTLVWFGLNWSLDLYEQFNARLRRQGQGVPVICHRILCKDTLDQAQAEALTNKASTQQDIRKAVKNYRDKKLLTS